MWQLPLVLFGPQNADRLPDGISAGFQAFEWIGGPGGVDQQYEGNLSATMPPLDTAAGDQPSLEHVENI